MAHNPPPMPVSRKRGRRQGQSGGLPDGEWHGNAAGHGISHGLRRLMVHLLPTVTTLRRYLEAPEGGLPARFRGEGPLVRPGDAPTLVRLLEKTMVAPILPLPRARAAVPQGQPGGAPAAPREVDAPGCAFADVVSRAIASLVTAEARVGMAGAGSGAARSVGWNEGNVLCRGFRLARGSAKYNAFKSQGLAPGVQAVYPNTVAEGVKFSEDGAWDALLDRVGEARMLALLTQCYVFLHVVAPARGPRKRRRVANASGNDGVGACAAQKVMGGTYVQLCGPPLVSRIKSVGSLMIARPSAKLASAGKSHRSDGRDGDEGDAATTPGAHTVRPAQPVGRKARRATGKACKLVVDRSRTFYNPAFPPKATLGLRREHPLIQLCQRGSGSKPALRAAAMDLLRLAFYGKCGGGENAPAPRARERVPLGLRMRALPVLEAFVLKMQRALRLAAKGACPVTNLLRLHCGAPQHVASPPAADAGEEAACAPEATGKGRMHHYCSLPQVLRFLWATLRYLMPNCALGDSPGARRALKERLSVFLGLRRYEKWNAEQAALGVPLSAFDWLFQWESSSSPRRLAQKKSAGTSDDKRGKKHMKVKVQKEKPTAEASEALRTASETARAQARLLRWIHFVYDSLCVPLLAAHFYVTDSEAYRMQIFYYRKTVWASIARASVKAMCQPSGPGDLAVYTPVSREEAGRMLRDPSRRLGLANLRLLPKSSAAVRPIVSLNRASTTARLARGMRLVPREFESINQTLAMCLVSLRCEINRNPHFMGSSVTGMDDMYRRLAPWIRACKRKRARDLSRGSAAPGPGVSGAQPKYYFVVADVAKAYDSLLQPRVMEVVNALLGDHDYDLIRFVTVRPADVNVQFRYERRAVPTVDHRSFLDFVVDQILKKEGRTPAILTDGVSYSEVTRAHVLALVLEHVTGTLVRGPDGKLYRQQLGICQGSNIGSILCSAYLAQLERAHGLGTRADGNAASVLMRQVDDFFFATDSLPEAMDFAEKVAGGFPDYGCYFNVAKTVCNFGSAAAKPYVDPEGREFVRWCGMMMDTSTLAIRADYTRYMYMNVSTTISVDGGSTPGVGMQRKLIAYLRPKAHALFFDTALNGLHVASVNVYQIFYLCALKFHAYVLEMRKLAVGPRSRGASAHTGTFHFAAIMHAINFFCILVRNRIERMSPYGAVCTLRSNDIAWLGLSAFVHALSRKHGHHSKLLPLLRDAVNRRKKQVPLNRKSFSACVTSAADATAAARLFESVLFG